MLLPLSIFLCTKCWYQVRPSDRTISIIVQLCVPIITIVPLSLWRCKTFNPVCDFTPVSPHCTITHHQSLSLLQYFSTQPDVDDVLKVTHVCTVCFRVSVVNIGRHKKVASISWKDYLWRFLLWMIVNLGRYVASKLLNKTWDCIVHL